MSTRFAWDAENRLARLETGNSSTGVWSTLFEVTYDGDGRRVRRHSPGATYSYPAYNTVYVRPHYEVETISGEVTQYYFFGGQRVVLRRNGVLYYLFTDHLGSASVSYRADGGNVVGQRYEPWGEVDDLLHTGASRGNGVTRHGWRLETGWLEARSWKEVGFFGKRRVRPALPGLRPDWDDPTSPGAGSP
jgi:hypothetical protein